MKKLLAVILFLSFTMTSFAQYIEGQEPSTGSGITTMMVGNDRDEHGCIGSAGYTWDENSNQCVRPWEQKEEARICTMDYNPVCAEVQVQCIKAPCFPVNQTFGNACGAGDNKVIYQGECINSDNSATYKRYQKYEDVLLKKLVNISTQKLEKMLELTNKMIEQTPLLKMAKWALERRTTQLVFIKNLIQKELSTRY
ncbi:MAG: hypothetical protein PHV23_00195 [Candidatus Gracilibacteria bacterium]|nr:hypothetical protein [Candidatus Gracilibacteria bacterium]